MTTDNRITYHALDVVKAEAWQASDDPLAASELARNLRMPYEALTRTGRLDGVSFAEFLDSDVESLQALAAQIVGTEAGAADPTGGP